MDEYAGEDSLLLEDPELELDEWICEDAFHNKIRRYGFYQDEVEESGEHEGVKRVSSPILGPVANKRRNARKLSMSKIMINFDLPSEASSDAETDDLTQADDVSVI